MASRRQTSTLPAAYWPLAKSGDDGSFTIAHAPSNWRELRAETKSDIAIATRGTGTSYTLHMRRGTTVTGIVRDAKTRIPVAGMIIGARDEGTITDAAGAFTFSPILPGRYALTGSHPLYERIGGGPLSGLSVPLGGSKETIAATPLPLVSGTVIDEERKPVAGAVVGRINRFAELPGAGTFSRRNGTFTFRVNATPFDHQIEVSKDGYADTTFNVNPGESKSGVNVTLTRGVPLASVSSTGRAIRWRASWSMSLRRVRATVPCREKCGAVAANARPRTTAR